MTDFDDRTAEWKLTEELVENVIQYYGWGTIPRRKFNTDGGNSVAPMLEKKDELSVLPDIEAMKEGRIEWVEVKMKSCFDLHRKSQKEQHGVDRSNWKDYEKMQRESGHNVWLFIYEKCTGVLLRQKLDKIFIHHEWTDGGANGEHMVYFNRELFDSVPIKKEMIPDKFGTQDLLPLPELDESIKLFKLFSENNFRDQSGLRDFS